MKNVVLYSPFTPPPPHTLDEPTSKEFFFVLEGDEEKNL